MANAVERIYPTVIPYTANTDVPFDLYTNNLVEQLQFQLAGTLTLAGYTTAPVKRVEAVENLLRNVKLDGAGKQTGAQTDTFCNVDAAYLAYQTKCQETTAPSRIDVGTANAAYQFLSTFTRYNGLKRTDKYGYGFIDPRLMSKFTLTLGWRDVSAMIQPGTGAGGTATLSGVGVTVHSVEWAGAPISLKRPYVKQTQRVFDLTNLSGIDKDFLNAPVSNFMPRQTFKGTVGDVQYADPTDSIFTTTQRAEGAHVKTIQDEGGYTFIDGTYSQLKAKQKALYSLESVPAGYLTLEYSRQNTLMGCLRLQAARSLKNTLDITTTGGSVNTLQITDEQIIWK